MLTCIACSKQLNNGSLNQREIEEDVAACETPRTKQAIKALTAQVCILLPALRSPFYLWLLQWSQRFEFYLFLIRAQKAPKHPVMEEVELFSVFYIFGKNSVKNKKIIIPWLFFFFSCPFFLSWFLQNPRFYPLVFIKGITDVEGLPGFCCLDTCRRQKQWKKNLN